MLSSSRKPDAKAAIDLLGPHLAALRAAAVAAHANASPSSGDGGRDRGKTDALAGAALHIAAMKQASRAAYTARAAHLAEVNAAKERFEATSLRLQNLQYARDQLQREIQRCREFPTTEMDSVKMVPEAEFRKDTGYKKKMNKRKHGVGNNYAEEMGPDEEAHQLTLLRLRHELELRKSLGHKLGRLREQAKEMDIATGLKTRFLADANDRLKALEDATLPLQRFFGLESTAKDKRHLDAVTKLAGPLYVIYRQLDAYSQTVAEVANSSVAEGTGSRKYGKVTITIVPALPFAGSHTSVAKDYVELPYPSALVTRHGDGGSNSGEDVSSSSASKKRKRGNEGDDQEQNTVVGEEEEAAEVAVFPKAVLAKFRLLHDAQKRVHVRFQMVPALNVVTAEIEGDVKGSRLSALFPGDLGVEDGDYASERVQKAAQAGTGTSGKSSTGRAYLWAQWLGGAKRLAGKGWRDRVRPSVPSIVEALLH